MDTSEQYIKMCEKAEEIQGAWKAKGADFIAFEAGHGGSFMVRDGHEEGKIWLPRQDQLQEMVRRPKYSQSNIRLIHRFYAWLKSLVVGENGETYYVIDLDYESLEQLWLSFVMKERYNKVWNGEEWKHES